jgi:hypothetical protein
VESALRDPALGHIHIDISWGEVAKFIMNSAASVSATAALINKYPDRFLMGTDEMAPASEESYLKVYYLYKPLFQLLTPDARHKLLKGNYERLFNTARTKVRQWEMAHAGDTIRSPAPTPSSGISNE